MATRTATITKAEEAGYDVRIAAWAGLLNGDDGSPLGSSDYSDRSVQVTGTFGAAGSVSIEGSNDGTNYAQLSDPQGNALAITAAKIEQISELTRYIRPRVTAGDGTTTLVVTLLARRAR